MSRCMTIDDSIDQKDTCTEVVPKEIVQYILEEVLVSALLVSDKGCSRIGDFNITEDFCQQYDRLPYLKDFEQISYTANPSATNQESNANSGKSTDRATSLVTAKENLELIIDSFVNKDERNKVIGECTIISEEALADNELQIQNGQSHIEKNKREEGERDLREVLEAPARDYFHKKDIIRDEKIEIQFYNEGKLSKIYVPLIPSNRIDVGTSLGSENVEERSEGETEGAVVGEVVDQWHCTEDTERPFKHFTAEEFRQVFSDDSVDPNRPRACAFGEEDVKKIIKEIEEISFTQSHINSEEFDRMGFLPDGQGDADLESRSLTRSKDSLEEVLKEEGPEERSANSITDLEADKMKNSDEFPGEDEREVFTSEQLFLDHGRQYSPEASISEQSVRHSSDKVLLPEVRQSTHSVADCSFVSRMSGHSSNNANNDVKAFKDNIMEEQRNLQYQVLEEECQLQSRFCSNRVGNSRISDQALDTAFSIDLPAGQRPLASLECIEDMRKSFVILTSREERQNELDANDPPPWETSEKPFGSNQGHLTKRNSELSSERDVGTLEENLSDMFKTTCNMNSLHDEDLALTMNSFTESSHSQDNDADNHSQAPNSFSDCRKTNSGLQLGPGNAYVPARKLSDELRVTEPDSITWTGSVGKDFDGASGDDEDSSKEIQLQREGSSLSSIKTPSKHEIKKNVKNSEETDDKSIDIDSSASSSTSSQKQISSHSLTGSVSRPQHFKLHSQKMYSGVNHEPDSQAQKVCVLTESEEALIDEVESVLQIIEPQEHGEDEDSSQVSFSLLCKPSREFSPSTHELPEKNHFSEEKTTTKKVYSGMTTIGPLKNTDYDPKDLAVPNVDYGKMTRITSSRQLAKEIDMFGSELAAAASMKILEDDSDNDISENIDDADQMEFTSLVNRDIASLTKVQKVREVMSHQPKPEDDFEDEDALPRPRLDLKDVESMTDERYKVPEVSIPLLSLEIGESNGAEKELIENMGLVLSSLTNPVYYEEVFEENSLEPEKDNVEDEYVRGSKASEECPVEKAEDVDETALEGSEGQNLQQADSADPQQDQASSSPKYSTLGSVFRKASNKFIRRDGDLLLRNSKSLPRDTSKITATESIRSILDDCQSSASSMLKKSKSLLKNTQSIFKSMSSSRVPSDPDPAPGVEKKKLSPSESDVSTLERKLSTFLRKEDFTKAKNLLKTKVEKTLKNFDLGGSSTSRPFEKVPSEKKDLRVAVIEEQKLRVDRIENFRKLLPKSPLVYKSQFVKSQMSMQNNSSEPVQVASTCAFTIADEGLNDTENFSVEPVENRSDGVALEEAETSKPGGGSEVKLPLQEKAEWLAEREECRLKEEESEAQQPEFIVMETVQGLPTTDLDSPSSDKENIATKRREQVEREAGEVSSRSHTRTPEHQRPKTWQCRDQFVSGNEKKRMEASDSFEACAEGVNDTVPCSPESEEEKMATKAPSDRKIKTKKKKLTARFRSFWCSAFGKVKSPPKKGEHS